MGAHVRRWGLVTAGWLLTVTGVVLFPLPGPGLLLLALGLALLAEQYEWAERRVDAVRHRALVGAARGVVTTPRAVVSVAVTIALTASGLLWLWKPAEPAWWVLPSWTWLPGGVWTGVGQVVSGLATLVLVVWCVGRFHGRPEEVARLEQLPRDGMLHP